MLVIGMVTGSGSGGAGSVGVGGTDSFCSLMRFFSSDLMKALTVRRRDLLGMQDDASSGEWVQTAQVSPVVAWPGQKGSVHCKQDAPIHLRMTYKQCIWIGRNREA